jgi:[ribosomal protein S18]-alanine N-acetyltransferase
MTSLPEKSDAVPDGDASEQDMPRASGWAMAKQCMPIIAGMPVELCKSDIPALVALERLCFSVPWSAKQYETVISNEPFHVFGIRQGQDLVGYLTLFAAAWEMEILNIAVHPSGRRMGHGQRMLSHVLHLCRKMGIKRGYLEVRRSNIPAQSLYTAFGFEEVGVRRRYYPDNREDAIIMRLDLETAPQRPD